MENLFDKSFWIVLHTMSFIYPEDPNIDDKKKNYNFIKSIRDIIPCEVCKRDYTNYINETIHQPENKPENEPETNPDKSIKITYESNVLKNKQNYTRWVIKFHNRVNKNLNKKEYSFEEVKDYYENIIRNSEMLKDKYNNDKNENN